MLSHNYFGILGNIFREEKLIDDGFIGEDLNCCPLLCLGLECCLLQPVYENADIYIDCSWRRRLLLKVFQ